MNAIVAFAVLFVVAVSARQHQRQNCPNFQPLNNLQSSRMAGQWYGVQSYNEGFEFPHFTCLKSNVQVDADGKFTSALQFSVVGNPEIANRNEIGTPVDGHKAKLDFENADQAEDNNDLSFILATDYDNYAVWGSCMTADNQHGYNVAITSRQKSLAPEYMEQAKQALRAQNRDADRLQPIENANC